MGMKNFLENVDRGGFRKWLEENHATEKECWVVVKRGKPSGGDYFWYLDAVEEALCFGWIDGVTKKLDDGSVGQRFSPRAKRSPWTELNKERVRRMERLGKMTDAGRAVLPDMSEDGFVIDADILSALKADKQVYENFLSFPLLYRNVRVDTIQRVKPAPELFQNRLEKLVENTKNGIMYGDWNDHGRLLD